MEYVKDEIAYKEYLEKLDRMNLFLANMVNADEEEDEELFTDEFSSLLYQNNEYIKAGKAYSGLLPELSGNCDNIVNKVLNWKDIDLTKVGKSFYTSNLLDNTPKDSNSKKLYGSVINQLVCYNILNTAEKGLHGACTLKLDTTNAPAWFNLENTCKLLVYILRERKINALALKRNDNCDLFIETYSRDISKKDEIKSSIDYIKLIIKGDIADTQYHTVEIKVKEVIDSITKQLFEFKMEPMQNRLYDAEEYWTNLESVEDEVKSIKYIEDKEDKYKECYRLSIDTLKICRDILVKLNKQSSRVNELENLTELYGVCSKDLDIDLQDEIVTLAKYVNTGCVFIGEEDNKIIDYYVDKGIHDLLNLVFDIVKKYRDSYLYLNMDMSENELQETEKVFENLG